MNLRNFDDLPEAAIIPTHQITVRVGRQSYTFSLSFPGLSREIDATRRRISEREQRRVNAELFYLLGKEKTK